jgi:hypothetical protein
MRKPKRAELVQGIIKKTGIPRNVNSLAYFTRQQLVELNLFIDKQNEAIERLSKEEAVLDGERKV